MEIRIIVSIAIFFFYGRVGVLLLKRAKHTYFWIFFYRYFKYEF